jgi:ATP-dependent Clp protease ATP-binding subunit ClpA
MQTLPGSALDPDASAVMKACNVDLGALKKKLADYLDNELRGLVNPDGDDARPTSAFQRVIQRAVFDIQSSDSKGLPEPRCWCPCSPRKKVWLLGEQNMTQRDAVNFMVWSMASSRRAERR